MGEPILQTDIQRETGYLYYVSTDKNGNLVLCKAKMKHGGTKKKDKEKK